MKKGILLVFVVLAMLPLVVGGDFGCCIGGTVNCAYVTESSCDGEWNGDLSCSNFGQCDVGCCVYSDGLCSEGAVEDTCIAEGGDFEEAYSEEYSCYSEDVGEGLAECSPGCCIVGDIPYYMTETECNYNFDNLQQYQEK